jgi:hypothetical protein
VYIYIYFISYEYSVMRVGGYVAIWEKVEVCTGCWWENLRERGHSDDPGIDGSIISRWIFKKLDVGHGLDLCGLG